MSTLFDTLSEYKDKDILIVCGNQENQKKEWNTLLTVSPFLVPKDE